MKTVSVICEKGGTGKTFIASEIYYSFIRNKFKTSFYALDGQYENRTKKEKNPDVIVVDTAGNLSEDTSKIIKQSDAIIVPIAPTANNIEPFTRTMDLIKENTKAPVVVVVNMSNNYTSAKTFIEWLSKQKWVKDFIEIPQAEAVRQAEAQQCSVYDVDKRKVVSSAIGNLYKKVLSVLKIKAGKAK